LYLLGVSNNFFFFFLSSYFRFSGLISVIVPYRLVNVDHCKESTKNFCDPTSTTVSELLFLRVYKVFEEGVLRRRTSCGGSGHEGRPHEEDEDQVNMMDAFKLAWLHVIQRKLSESPQ
jgi:hypothetical protein